MNLQHTVRAMLKVTALAWAIPLAQAEARSASAQLDAPPPHAKHARAIRD